MTYLDSNFESIDVSSIKTAYTIVCVLTIISAITIVPLLMWPIWKVLFGFIYDVKRIRYYEDSKARALKKANSEKELDLNVRVDVTKPYDKYGCKNIVILIQNDVFSYYVNQQLETFGRVKSIENTLELISPDAGVLKMKKEGNDLKDSNGTIYKKVASK